LPLTRTERFYTSAPYQEVVEIRVYEGEDEDALRNILVGDFRVENLKPVRESSEILCRMNLDLDGVLHVTAVEKSTGNSKHITIARALEMKTETEISEARNRLEVLYSTRVDEDEEEVEWPEAAEGEEIVDPEELNLKEQANAPLHAGSTDEVWVKAAQEARQLVERSRRLLEQIQTEDREEVIHLNEKIGAALVAEDATALREETMKLGELLFFVEGKE
jgi:molecular chaperone DnaK (HSP70)